MKKILLLGRMNGLGKRFSSQIHRRGYSIKQIQKPESLKGLLDASDPELVLCTGTIRIDAEGNYYLEL